MFNLLPHWTQNRATRPLLDARKIFGLSALIVTGCGNDRLNRAIPLLTASQQSIDFGELFVGASTTRQVSINSVGTARVQIHSATLQGDAAFTTAERRNESLPPYQSLLFEIIFAPTEEGDNTAKLTVENDSENLERIEVMLSGRGLAPPDCDDANPCTNDSFNTTTQTCERIPRTGLCDDNSLCTTGDECVSGHCVGTALDCDDADACTLNLCDPMGGCVFVEDTTICADNNPCTLDTCSQDTGCSHAAVSDGTSCPGEISCASIHLCLAGNCASLPAPDGMPCDDANLCTVSDQCSDQVCGGNYLARDPELLDFLNTFGALDGEVVFLRDGRVVFADRAASSPYFGGDIAISFSTIEPPQAVLSRRQSSLFEHLGAIRNLEPIGTSGFAAVGLDPADDFTTPLLRLYNVAPDGTVTTPPAPAVSSFWFYWATASFGDVYYACSDNLTAVDFGAGATPASWAGALSAGTCTDMAIDAANEMLVVATDDGIARFDLSNPSQPVWSDTVLAGIELIRVAAHASSVVVVPGDGSQAQVYDSSPFVLLATIPAAPDREIVEVRYVGDHLLVVEQTPWGGVGAFLDLHLYSLSTPAAPTLLGSQTISQDHAYFLTYNANFLTSNDDLLILSQCVGCGSRVFRVDGNVPITFAALTGPGHGRIRMLSGSPELFTLARDSVHRVDLTDPSDLSFIAGSSFDHHANMMSLTAGAHTPTYLLGSDYSWTDPQVHTWGTNVGLWLDVSNPASTAVVGSRAFVAARPYYRSSGDTLYVARFSNWMNHIAFEIVDLAAEAPSFDGVFVPLGAVDIPFQLPVWSVEWWILIAYDSLQQRAAVVLNAAGGGNPATTIPVESQVAVLDISNHEAPTLIGEAIHPWNVASVAIAGDIVLLTEALAAGVLSGQRSHHLFDLQGDGTLLERSSFDIDNAMHVLAFDGVMAILATTTGLSFVDTSPAVPAIVGELPLPQPPRTLSVINDHLFLGSNSGVAAVYPPCPAP